MVQRHFIDLIEWSKVEPVSQLVMSCVGVQPLSDTRFLRAFYHRNERYQIRPGHIESISFELKSNRAPAPRLGDHAGA
ncbi:hypothetical protein EVAR_88022_1 [Eumeta japonica]|uniref:Uncharacterized protein n=1 Tax=Eumeta variegata TaxID=151549 RepID=A0A4C1VDS5_EUMVA|nr:hypothetical protein EVAR_88022_1 [Eumeta japonica]